MNRHCDYFGVVRLISVSVMLLAGTQAQAEVPGSTPAVISLVGISNISLTTATISWSTDVPSDSQVEYGTTFAYDGFSRLNPEKVTQHIQILAGLAPGTTYHFRVMSRDADGNLSVSLYDYTFETLELPDQVPPVISAVAITDVTTSTVTIYWKTDEPSDSQIGYGPTAQYDHLSASNSALGVLHSITLKNLSAGMTYHYHLLSRDAGGNLGTSADLTFSTLGPPAVSGINVSAIAARSATISWTTDVAADTQVAYGTTEQCELSTALNPALTTTHVQQLDGLDPGTTYYFKVLSKNAAGQLGVTERGAFETADKSTFELTIPRLATTAGQHKSGWDDSMHTGIAIANLGSQETTLTFTAYDVTGARIAGADVVNPAVRVLPAAGQLAIADGDLFGAGFPMANPVGWIDILSTGKAVTGMSALFNGSLSVLDGAPLFTAPMTSFVFPEIDEGGPTILHIANSNKMPDFATLVLLGSDGVPKSYANRTIAPMGALAESAATLFKNAAPESTDSIMVYSNLGVSAYELLGEGPGDVAGINGIDATSGAKRLYCPQYVAGGSYRSALSIVDAGGTEGNVTLRLSGFDGEQIGTTQKLPITAYGKILISDPGFFGVKSGEEVSGYIEIESDGPSIVGSVLFLDASRTASNTALPLVSQLQESLVFSQAASDATYYTGVALLNPGDSDISATVNLYSSGGSLLGSVDLPIPAHHRISKLLTELYPAVSPHDSGYIRVSATAGLAGFSVFGTYDMETLSAVAAQVVR